jgi:phenylalanyl-tRNA synthetase beta chain
LNLYSDSANRFSKGVNLDLVEKALDVAAAFVAKLGEGKVVTGKVWGSKQAKEVYNVEVSLAEINGRIGTNLTTNEVSDILDRLSIPYEVIDNETPESLAAASEVIELAVHKIGEGINPVYKIKSPMHRFDIQIPSDVIEEVARLYGYNNIPSTLPKSDTAAALTPLQKQLRTLRTNLEANGLSEAITYSLTTKERNAEFVTFAQESAIELDWPMTLDHSVARTNLVSGLLEAVSYNQARKNKNVAIYEIGKVFETVEGELLPNELEHMSFALSGNRVERDYLGQAVKYDFFDAKGILGSALASLGVDSRFELVATSDIPELHPGRSAWVMIGHTKVGFIGQVHPTTAKKYDINETYVAQINLFDIFARECVNLVFENVSKFPSVTRDIALLVDADTTNGQIVDTIKNSGGKYLRDVKLFDLYTGANIDEGKKSLAYSLTFVNSDKSFEDEDINRFMTKIEKALSEIAEVR